MAGVSSQCSRIGGLAWSPDAFTFQWKLAVVQVSNWFSSETVRAAKVLEESQPVTGASTSGVFTAKPHYNILRFTLESH